MSVKNRLLAAVGGGGGGGGNADLPEGSGAGGSAITGASGVRSAGRRLQSKLKPEAAASQARSDPCTTRPSPGSGAFRTVRL